MAHRVGIISRGKLVAEGTPDSLKRSIADDLLLVEVAGYDADAMIRLDRLDGVRSVTRDGDRITMRVVDGPAALSSVALTLSQGGLQVRSMTMRTPSLDDVFFELTGGRIEEAA